MDSNGNAAFSGTDTGEGIDPEQYLPGLAEQLPGGWTVEFDLDPNISIIPHGMNMPLFAGYFTDSTRLLDCEATVREYPHLFLYFYSITQKDIIDSIVAEESVFSWCIPVLYGQTDSLYIISTPCYTNGGCFSDRHKEMIAPLHEALGKYFTGLQGETKTERHRDPVNRKQIRKGYYSVDGRKVCAEKAGRPFGVFVEQSRGTILRILY